MGLPESWRFGQVSKRARIIAALAILWAACSIFWPFFKDIVLQMTPQEATSRTLSWAYNPWTLFACIAYWAIAILLSGLALFFEPITKLFYKTRLEKLLAVVGIDDLVDAKFGVGVLGDAEHWKDTTEDGQRLVEWVKYLLRQPNEMPTTLDILKLPPRFRWAMPKQLRLTFSNEAVIVIDDGKPLRLESAQVISMGLMEKRA
jgi:hypothetical protein